MGEFRATSSPPDAPPVLVSPHLTLQPPLSRRGHGPGLILIVDFYALLEKSEKSVDPPPLQKWAEEGFAVVQLQVPGKAEDGGEFPLQRAIEILRGCKGCDQEQGFGLISYLSRIPFYVAEAAYLSPDIKAIISYTGHKFTTINTSASSGPPQLLHISGPVTPRRESCSIVPPDPDQDASSSSPKPSPEGIVKSHRYIDATTDSAWILPADEDYHSASASLAHTRSLAFLKPLLNGPYFDLEAVWDEHCRYEFGERDVAKTMATMVAEPYVNHIPTMTGGVGKERLTAFYTHHFVFSNPEDTKLELVSRTVGVDRVVDEFVFSLTHDRVVEWLLPGIPPTHKHLRIPFTAFITLRGDRLSNERIHWDQGTALHQAGLLPQWVPFPYAIDGNSPAQGKKFEVQLPVAGEETAKKLVDEGSVESNAMMESAWREVDG
ncbi:dienelactone hydrolase-like protein [Massariosphaeria phaeospora]|uniref:Dienelactone hydrolase-like protein n=1 Tax=Massariosphaeria phaeospora TaxID=100035 RepID=A0A7C8IEB4_9PLEO|nr:dienelactone hydrolase-like protein [Massariosphaeria phaeospora]